MRPQDLRHDRLQAAYERLPPLGSRDYIAYLGRASAEELPPEVLVRAYLELWHAKEDEAAECTLTRLLDLENRYGYLRPIIIAVRRRRVERRRDVEDDDLLAETCRFIVNALHSGRGVFATQNWKVFCYQRVKDAARAVYGRQGQRTDKGRVYVDPELDTSIWEGSPLFESIARLDDREPELRERLLDFIDELLENWDDRIEREVISNSLSPDPLQITTKRADKPSLDKKLGVSRDIINRAAKRVVPKLKAAILGSGRFTIEEIRRIYPEVKE